MSKPKMSTKQLFEGGIYLREAVLPVNAHSEYYQILHLNVQDIPAYQRKIVFRKLTGTNAGQVICSSYHNFCIGYRVATDQEAQELNHAP